MHALVVIDLQQASFSGSAKHDQAAMLPRINAVARAVRLSGGPVVFVLHDGDESDGLVPGTPGWRVHAAIDTRPSDIVVRKRLNDGFAGTDLAERLAALGVNQLVISGWATDFCVDSTVRSAVSRGYAVVVLEDGHTLADRPHLDASKVIEHHNWVWANLIISGPAVLVASSAAYLATLDQGAPSADSSDGD